jgi:hypothetical protein
MPPDLQKLFETQAAWQRSRAQLPWPEKVRMAELMREAVRTLRGDSAGHSDRTAGGVRPLRMRSGTDACAGTAASVEPPGETTEAQLDCAPLPGPTR